jgi:uncharacterized HAD superfamily protein
MADGQTSITGKIIAVLPLQSGQGQKGEWKKQDAVIETDGQYPKKICVTFFNKALTDEVALGNRITVTVNLDSREYNGKWYNQINAWKITDCQRATQTSQPKQNEDEQNYHALVAERQADQSDFHESEMPF